MTADWVRLPYEVLATISSRIANEVKGVNRAIYDISNEPPSIIDWEWRGRLGVTPVHPYRALI